MLQAVVLRRVNNAVQPQTGAFSYQPQATPQTSRNLMEMGGKGLHGLEIEGSHLAHSVPPIWALVVRRPAAAKKALSIGLCAFCSPRARSPLAQCLLEGGSPSGAATRRRQARPRKVGGEVARAAKHPLPPQGQAGPCIHK